VAAHKASLVNFAVNCHYIGSQCRNHYGIDFYLIQVYPNAPVVLPGRRQNKSFLRFYNGKQFLLVDKITAAF